LPPGELARHAYLAGDRLDPERAIVLLLDAARAAKGRFAAEEQRGHLRRAYELSAASPRRRGMIALDLGRELHHDGEHEAARRLFDEADAIARDLDDPELPARVALVFHRHYGQEQALDRLRDAHRRLIGGPVPDDGLAIALVLRLGSLARKGGDDDALAFSLWTHHDIIWGPGTAAERVALTGELIDVAQRTADRELEHFARALRWVALAEQGEPRYLDEFHAYAARGRRSERPHLVMTTDIDESIVAGLEGRFAEAESLLAAVDPDTGREHFGFMLDHHRWVLTSLRGETGGLEELLRRLRGSGHPCVHLLEALTALRTGDLGTALRRAGDEEPDDRMIQPIWLRVQAELAAAGRDPELCARARARLAPHRGRWVVAVFGWEISGPYDLWLGLVDAAQGRWAEAVEELTAAYRAADAMRARPWSVLARGHLAETLRSRGAPGDAEAARELAEGARRDAAELGMRQVLPHLLPTSPDPDDPPHPTLGDLARTTAETAPGHRPQPSPASPDGGRPTPGGESRPNGPRPTPGNPANEFQPDDAGPATGNPAGGFPPGGAGPTPGGPAGQFQTDGAGPAPGEPAGRFRTDDAGPATGNPGGEFPPGGAGPAPGGTGGEFRADGAGPVPGEPAGEFRPDGAVWSLVFAGRTAHLPDAKGLRDLHTLLGRPGDDVPAVALLAPEGGAVVVAARRLGGDPVLDEEAKARYRHHLARLDEEIDRAAEVGDDDRAAGLDRERAALLAELRAAAGLGGRTRRLGDEAERARKTVTARIRDTLRKLDQAHPELAAHLRASVSTGSTCRYRPAEEIAWRL
ncbi:hypothetical protein ACWEPC_41260, partial [Nonomuraea sp. NPDC004297]